jgi:hypothetical protein
MTSRSTAKEARSSARSEGTPSVKSRCPECRKQTNHHVRGEWTRTERQGRHTQRWFWQILECAGCEEVSHRTLYGDKNELRVVFPARERIQVPIWAEFTAGAGDKFCDLFCEVCHAINAGYDNLAGTGIRTLADQLIRETVGDQGNFTKGIDAMVSGGHLSTA